jgi:purine-cytosine permease-like protein
VLTGVDSIRPIRPRRVHRIVTIVVLAVVWFAISLAVTGDAVSAVATGLTLMLYLLVPWTAANLVDFFVVRRGHYAITDLFRPDGVYGVWQWRGLAAYGIGLLAEVPFMVLPGAFTGPLAAALGEVDVAWLVGLAVTAAAYLVFSRSLDRSAEHAAEASSETRLGHAAS